MQCQLALVPGEALAGAVVVVGADRPDKLLVVCYHHGRAGNKRRGSAQQNQRGHGHGEKEPLSRPNDHLGSLVIYT